MSVLIRITPCRIYFPRTRLLTGGFLFKFGREKYYLRRERKTANIINIYNKLYIFFIHFK